MLRIAPVGGHTHRLSAAQLCLEDQAGVGHHASKHVAVGIEAAGQEGDDDAHADGDSDAEPLPMRGLVTGREGQGGVVNLVQSSNET